MVNSCLRRYPDTHEAWTALRHSRAGGITGLAAQVPRACSFAWLVMGRTVQVRMGLWLSPAPLRRPQSLSVSAMQSFPELPNVLAFKGPTEANLAFFMCKDASQYKKGVLRSIMCNGVLTQHAPLKQGRTDSGTCLFCKPAPETPFHLFWQCPTWSSVRTKFRTPPASNVQAWEPCTNLCGIFHLPMPVRNAMGSLNAEAFTVLPCQLRPGEGVIDAWIVTKCL